jgi:hypothetical protein
MFVIPASSRLFPPRGSPVLTLLNSMCLHVALLGLPAQTTEADTKAQSFSHLGHI